MSWKFGIGTLIVVAALAVVARAVDAEDGTATWDITRASAFTTYLLLWAAVFTGTGVNTRFHPGLARQLVVLELHRMLATLSLAFLLVHILTLVMDPFIGFAAWDGFVPFISGYRPIQVGLGVIGGWLMAGVLVSTWMAGYYSHRGWRLAHYLAYPAFLLALVHGLTSGSDTEHWPTHVVYSATSGVLLGALFVRFVAHDWVQQALHPHEPAAAD